MIESGIVIGMALLIANLMVGLAILKTLNPKAKKGRPVKKRK